MMKVKKLNLKWADINMAELDLTKLISHFAQSNKAAVQEVQDAVRAEVIQISANDPNLAREQLNRVLVKESAYNNVSVSPLNTKLQAVGLYLAWESNPDTQIVIAFPDRFSSWLTRGIKEVKRFRI